MSELNFSPSRTCVIKRHKCEIAATTISSTLLHTYIIKVAAEPHKPRNIGEIVEICHALEKSFYNPRDVLRISFCITILCIMLRRGAFSAPGKKRTPAEDPLTLRGDDLVSRGTQRQLFAFVWLHRGECLRAKIRSNIDLGHEEFLDEGVPK